MFFSIPSFESCFCIQDEVIFFFFSLRPSLPQVLSSFLIPQPLLIFYSLSLPPYFFFLFFPLSLSQLFLYLFFSSFSSLTHFTYFLLYTFALALFFLSLLLFSYYFFLLFSCLSPFLFLCFHFYLSNDLLFLIAYTSTLALFLSLISSFDAHFPFLFVSYFSSHYHFSLFHALLSS